MAFGSGCGCLSACKCLAVRGWVSVAVLVSRRPLKITRCTHSHVAENLRNLCSIIIQSLVIHYYCFYAMLFVHG